MLACPACTHRADLQVTWHGNVRSSYFRAASLGGSNFWLRQGLGQLGLRLREPGDADEALVGAKAVGAGEQYVRTALGESLWHDTMQLAFASLGAAQGLPLFWSAEKPQAGQDHTAWQQNRIVFPAA